MSLQPLPPLVAPFEVDRFVQAVSECVGSGAPVLSVNPISDVTAPTFSAAVIESRLLALMRLAVQATYWSGHPVVKIVNLGDRWDSTDPVDGYLRTAAVTNHLNALARSGFGSLGRISVWGSEGPPFTYGFKKAIEGVENTLQMMAAMSLPITEKMSVLDLWFEHPTTPFRMEAIGVLEPPDWYLRTGHLIELQPPAFDWTNEESPLLARSRSPMSIDVSESNDFASHVLRGLPDVPRPLVLKFDPSESAIRNVLATLELASTLPHLMSVALVKVTPEVPVDEVVGAVELMRREGFGASGLELVAAEGIDFSATVEAASQALEALYAVA